MKRREFIAAIYGVITLPVVARAQHTVMPVIGLLCGAAAREWAPFLAGFLRGLGEAGFNEGRNVAIESRWAEGQYDRLPTMVAELIQRQVSVIAALTTPAAVAAKTATATIPIVFTTIGDPVQIGLVSSLSHPGGNITGATYLDVEVGPKLLELLREIDPTATTIAALINASNPNAETESRGLESAARRLGVELHILNAGTERDIERAFTSIAQLRVGGLIMGNDAFLNTRREQLAELALRYRVPAIFQTPEFVVAGGLMSYGGSAMEAYRQAGAYTGRILKGEEPANLPVVQATKVELSINLKTAKALGITIPPTLLARADEVIE